MFPSVQAAHLAALFKEYPMLTKLPLIMAGGTFNRLSYMPEARLEKFLSYLVRCTCQVFNKNPMDQPLWWTETVVYHPDFHLGQIPLPYTRNKATKLKRLIKLCYLHYNCKDLLNLSEKLAALHALSYKFVRNTGDTVTVIQVSTRSPIVMIPASNLDYDLDTTAGTSIKRELSIIPIRKSLMAYDSKPVRTKDDEVNNCILIEDSSSDDDVEIVSYEKGALPPTPPKKKLPIGVRPGPACSKVGFIPDVARRSLRPPVDPLPQHPPQACREVQSRRPLVPSKTPNQPQIVGNGDGPLSGVVPRPALQPPFRRNLAVNFRRRNARTLRRHNQTYTFVDIDLTIDDDEDDDPAKKSRLPGELPQTKFLEVFGLVRIGERPPESKSAPLVKEKTRKVLNLKNISFDIVPALVRNGVLPKRCLAKQEELDLRTSIVEKYLRRDYECSRVTVRVSNKAEVAAFTRLCYVKVKRLTSADQRKWRKRSS